MSNGVMVFVPAFGQMISATTFMTTHALQASLATKGLSAGITTLSFPDIAELRSMATTIWYDTLKAASHLLFIDADMGFSPDLVVEMLAFGEPVIGTLYPQRKMPLSWAGSGSSQPTTERRGNFMKVEGVGMGCTLIHRSAIEIMEKKFPELNDTRINMHPAGDMLKQAGTTRLLRLFEKMDLPDRGVVSEDLSFCLRWGQCGGSVWANIGYPMSHVGPYDYRACYLDTVNQKAAEEAQTAVPPDPGAIDEIFTPMNLGSVPIPGTGLEMPGGPESREKSEAYLKSLAISEEIQSPPSVLSLPVLEEKVTESTAA